MLTDFSVAVQSRTPHQGRDAAVLVQRIDAILPQTQCTQCGYSGCKPYAEAIAQGDADINQCPPGGDAGIHALAKLLKREYKPLNLEHGIYKPKALAVIDESVCIGCTLCIQACPVDAILGAAKYMHTVIAEECTGCELCIAPCPVDCITMAPFENPERAGWFFEAILNIGAKKPADIARERYESRLQRLKLEESERLQRNANLPASAAQDPKKAAIMAAMARANMPKDNKRPEENKANS
ncbi:electron transport complex subunit RsxB [Methylovorus sp. MM2]|uniref:electron transport complex subunit RsxB n=1 Tax=Methylovorus sp. MM2 TaxID=1848038 RepID=UPI0009EE54DC|nr:electron transport complex subunit RsxB [Methylovorus sp. MM2]